MSGKIITKIKKYKREENSFYHDDEIYISGNIEGLIKMEVLEFNYLGANISSLGQPNYENGVLKIFEPIISKFTDNHEVSFAVKKRKKMILVETISSFGTTSETFEKRIEIEPLDNLLAGIEDKVIPCFSPSIKVIAFRFNRPTEIYGSGPSAHETNREIKQFENKLRVEKGGIISFKLDLIEFGSTSGEIVVTLNTLNDLTVTSVDKKAITEIQNALNQNPPITNAELETANQDWQNEIQNASEPNLINNIKNRVLSDITAKRNAKNSGGGGDVIEAYRNLAIGAINTELQKDPVVKTTELETDRVLDDIKNKRGHKSEEKKVLELLSQAKTQNIYSELAQTIKELKKYFSTKTYQENQTEIEQQEAKLSRLDPDKYKREIENDLNEQIRNNGLESQEIEAETTKAIQEAIQDPTPSKKKVAEKTIAQNGANVELKKLLSSAKTAKTESEKKVMISKILNYPSKNSYCEESYRKLKAEVDKVLAQLQGKNLEGGNSQNSSLFLKVVLPLVLVGFGAVIIGLFGLLFCGILGGPLLSGSSLSLLFPLPFFLILASSIASSIWFLKFSSSLSEFKLTNFSAHKLWGDQREEPRSELNNFEDFSLARISLPITILSSTIAFLSL
ncbi:2930_t:CDS:2 [Funneliformis geosporum]|uniref:2930_t:CDS:1 n=1 Tax=Funneliformis geosporum TaxID=1117311 RepID=A0A9W4SAA9_9GLOM|nr:2930_t:CDS:2 [Funneliformis geosporum]